jgi:hypothetical protein
MAPNCFRSPCRISGMGIQKNKPGSERAVHCLCAAAKGLSHCLACAWEGRRRLHRRPRGQVSKFSTGAGEERQENPWSRGHSPGAKSSHCGRT